MSECKPKECPIDLVDYGALHQRVMDIDRRTGDIERKLDDLIELANKGKGASWAVISVASMISTFVGFVISNLDKFK